MSDGRGKWKRPVLQPGPDGFKSGPRSGGQRVEVGSRIGCWTVLAGPFLQQVRRYRCRCKCGTESNVRVADLLSGASQSCGCLAAKKASERNKTHGMTKSPEWRSWHSIKSRCTDPNSTGYEYWGGRGITVCDRWLNSFEAFYADMGPRPEGTSIDRWPNKDGNYEPGNCRWANDYQQMRNTRANHLLTFGGETHSLAEWAERIGLPAYRVQNRAFAGMTPEQILCRGKVRR